jgi:hypothetical protein
MSERMRILEQIETGEITVEEAVRRLEALSAHDESPETAAPTDGEATTVAEPSPPPVVRVLGQVILVIGSMFLAGGGYFLARSYVREGTAGSAWGWVLLVLGLLIVLLGWWLERAHWLHVQITPDNASTLTIPLPLPLPALSWLVRLGQPFSSQLRTVGAVELLRAMQDELRAGHSIVIEIDDEAAGEHVSIYIG